MSWAAALAFAVCAGLLFQASAVPASTSEAISPDEQAVSAQKVNQAYGGQAVKPAGRKPGSKPAGGKWAKATKDAKPVDGLFRIYKGKKTWHLQINPDQFDQQYILSLGIGKGIGAKFPLMTGMTLNDDIVRFKKVGEQILLLKEDMRFTAVGDEDLERAVDLSYAPSVAHVFKIAAEKKDTVLVDLKDFLVSDYADVGLYTKFSMGPAGARFDGKRSTLGKLQVFEKNLEMEANLTFTPNDRRKAQLLTVADDRWVPVTIHYSLMALPEPGYIPRLMDDRIGYFTTTKIDFAREDHETYVTHFINRWRLQKKDPSARISEPVKPITFYIENTVPEKWRPYIKEGIEKWQIAYEKAGFKNAIVALPQPDDSTFDAADIRYSTFRWITSAQQAFGAIGPSRADPRTGEIFDADILCEAGWILSFKNGYRRYPGPETIQEALDGITHKDRALLEEFDLFSDYCASSSIAFDSGNLISIAMLANGSMPPGSPVPDEYIGQTLVWLAMHEVGHTLGLRHNFQSSAAVPFDKLGDRSYLEQYGMVGSVMEYAAPFIKGNEQPGHVYFTRTMGPYDMWAIRYGYTPTVADNPFAEESFLAEIAEESAKPGHLYGTDFDTYSVHALDPRNNIFDLSSDPLEYGQWTAEFLSSTWANPDLEKRVLAPGTGYQTLRNAVLTMIFQYGRALSFGLKYVGGQEVSKAHFGDPGAPEPFEPIPAEQQREALNYLTVRAFAPDAFYVPPRTLNRMMSNRTVSWVNNPYQSRVDYPHHQIVLGLQTGVLNRLMEPQRMARVCEAQNRQANPLTVAELFHELTGAIWGEFGVGASAAPARQNPRETMEATAGNSTRRDLQRAYVDNLVKWVLEPAPNGTDDARALARLQLVRIDSACGRALRSGAPNDVVEAHLLETQARIERALNAQKTAKG
jgi:hypothetical protein